MIYSNDDPSALIAMEIARTGNYGNDYYDDEYVSQRCPICGVYEPEYYYVNDDDECIGCTECVHKVEILL